MNEKKTKRFGMVFTEYEQKILKQLSLADDLSESALIRRLIKEKAKERGIWIIKVQENVN